MENLPYQQAFERIRSEYLEMPGMRLTAPQVHRLSGVEIAICAVVLEDLVRAGFLHKGPDGRYGRGGSGEHLPRARTVKAGRHPSAGAR